MKIYWGLKRSRRQVQKNIARLERELGIAEPDPAKTAWLEGFDRTFAAMSNYPQVIPTMSSVGTSVTTILPPRPHIELPPGVTIH